MLKNRYIFALDNKYYGNSSCFQGVVEDIDGNFITIVRDNGAQVIINMDHVVLIYEIKNDE